MKWSSEISSLNTDGVNTTELDVVVAKGDDACPDTVKIGEYTFYAEDLLSLAKKVPHLVK